MHYNIIIYFPIFSSCSMISILINKINIFQVLNKIAISHNSKIGYLYLTNVLSFLVLNISSRVFTEPIKTISLAKLIKWLLISECCLIIVY